MLPSIFVLQLTVFLFGWGGGGAGWGLDLRALACGLVEIICWCQSSKSLLNSIEAHGAHEIKLFTYLDFSKIPAVWVCLLIWWTAYV